MKVLGRVVSFDEDKLVGEVQVDLEIYRFHSTSFHSATSFRWPRVGEQVDGGLMMSSSFDADAWQREVILRNEVKDPHYAPYCLPCPGLVRMRKIEPHYWRCRCGAECDYRTAVSSSPV